MLRLPAIGHFRGGVLSSSRRPPERLLTASAHPFWPRPAARPCRRDPTSRAPPLDASAAAGRLCPYPAAPAAGSTFGISGCCTASGMASFDVVLFIVGFPFGERRPRRRGPRKITRSGKSPDAQVDDAGVAGRPIILDHVAIAGEIARFLSGCRFSPAHRGRENRPARPRRLRTAQTPHRRRPGSNGEFMRRPVGIAEPVAQGSVADRNAQLDCVLTAARQLFESIGYPGIVPARLEQGMPRRAWPLPFPSEPSFSCFLSRLPLIRPPQIREPFTSRPRRCSRHHSQQKQPAGPAGASRARTGADSRPIPSPTRATHRREPGPATWLTMLMIVGPAAPPGFCARPSRPASFGRFAARGFSRRRHRPATAGDSCGASAGGAQGSVRRARSRRRHRRGVELRRRLGRRHPGNGWDSCDHASPAGPLR